MILIRETDARCDVLIPRRHAGGGPVVVLDRYRNGDRYDRAEFPYPLWGGQYVRFLEDGYQLSDDAPDLLVRLNAYELTLSVAGGPSRRLVRPGAGPDDDPAGSLVEQADVVLYREGFMRSTIWWAGGTTRMAFANPFGRITVPASMVVFTRAALDPVVAVLRLSLDLADPDQVGDWLDLGEDVLGYGFQDGLARIRNRRVAAFGPGDRVANAIGALDRALAAAHAGDVPQLVRQAAAAAHWPG
jgi:hypothetical protein